MKIYFVLAAFLFASTYAGFNGGCQKVHWARCDVHKGGYGNKLLQYERPHSKQHCTDVYPKQGNICSNKISYGYRKELVKCATNHCSYCGKGVSQLCHPGREVDIPRCFYGKECSYKTKGKRCSFTASGGHHPTISPCTCQTVTDKKVLTVCFEPIGTSYYYSTGALYYNADKVVIEIPSRCECRKDNY